MAFTIYFDRHHADYFKRALVEKGVEAFLAGQSPVFGNPFLAARANSLLPGCKEWVEDVNKAKADKAKAEATRLAQEAKEAKAKAKALAQAAKVKSWIKTEAT